MLVWSIVSITDKMLHMLSLLAAFIFVGIVRTNPTKVVESSEEQINVRNDDPYRLSGTVIPVHYEVILKLDENFGPNGTYSGSVKINITTTASTQEIILHSKYLDITAANIVLTCSNNPYNVSLSNLSEYEMISITLTNPIPTGSECLLEFTNYTGVLGDDMYGFYRSYYADENNATV